jgi:integrase/recombinase XerD
MLAQCLGMRNFTELPSVPSDHPVLFTDQLRLAVAAYLARFKGASRYHTESDLRALLTTARESPNPCDFALVAMPGLLGLRIFEATGADIADLGEEHGHRVLRVCGKGSKVVPVPLPPAAGRAIDRAVGTRACGPILLNSRGARMDRHAATRRLRRLAEAAGVRIARPHPRMLRHTFVTTSFDAGVDLRDVQIAARHADPRTTMRYDRARKNLGRHPNYILAAYMASGT